MPANHAARRPAHPPRHLVHPGVQGDFVLFEWHHKNVVVGASEVELINTLLAGLKAK